MSKNNGGVSKASLNSHQSAKENTSTGNTSGAPSLKEL